MIVALTKVFSTRSLLARLKRLEGATVMSNSISAKNYNQIVLEHNVNGDGTAFLNFVFFFLGFRFVVRSLLASQILSCSVACFVPIITRVEK